MTYQEMMYELEMSGSTQGTLRCFALAHDGGATDAELYEMFQELMCE